MSRDGANTTRALRAETARRLEANEPGLEGVELCGLWCRPGKGDPIGEEEMLRLIAALCGNTHVRRIGIGHNGHLTDVVGRALRDAVPLSAVESVRMNGCDGLSGRVKADIATACLAKRLAPVRANDPEVKSLSLSFSDLEDKHVQDVAGALEGNTHVLSLDLGNNELLTDACGAAILGAISRSAVHSVILCGNPKISDALKADIAAACVPKVVAALAADAPNVISLDTAGIWGVNFGDAEAAALANCLEANTQLQSLAIGFGASTSSSSLTDVGATHLKRVLGSGRSGVMSVRIHDSVNVSSARRSAIGQLCAANALRRATANDPALKRLPLEQHSGFADADMPQLAAALRTNMALRELSFTSNKAVTDTGIAILAKTLSESTVEKVEFHGSGVSKGKQTAVKAVLDQNRLRNAARKHEEDAKAANPELFDALTAMNLAQYLPSFITEGITVEMFPSLDDAQLIHLGLSTLGERLTFLAGQGVPAAEPEPEPELEPAAEEGEPPTMAVLRAELSTLKVRALTKRAEAIGVDDDSLDAAGEANDIIELIVAKEAERAAQESAKIEALRSELRGMKIRALTKRAEEMGVDEAALDDAESTEDLVALILGATLGDHGPSSSRALVVAGGAQSPSVPAAATESHGRVVEQSSDNFEFDFVFSNKTASDALCLTVRKRLIAHNLRVWQQKTNIPKDSENWFKEWYPSAISSKKIVCFVTTDYTKSEFCMKEFVVAQANRKLLVVACEPLSVIRQVDARQHPAASDFLAYDPTGTSRFPSLSSY
eukprot:COSAG03_NODE_2112_length_3114_cov_152.687231_1_plen_779_part_00